MWFMPRLRFGRGRETEALEQRVFALQAALTQCAEVAGPWTRFRREVTAVIAGFVLAGFALGIYGTPIREFGIDLAQAVGLSSAARSADDPSAAYRDGDYATALRLARPLAAEGDARAQFLLGHASYRGHGVARDHIEAVKWFRRSADRGDAVAQFYLGIMFSDGEGVPQDYAEAAKWYRRAADQGNAEAQYNLGVFYTRGEVWEADNASAYMWFSLAAANFPVSDVRHGIAVSSRDLVAKQMTRGQIAEAQRRTREWRPTPRM